VSDIHFFKEDIRFRLLHQQELIGWIASAVHQNKFRLDEINYIFCSDEYLLRLNKKFLQHNFYTDIITFDNSSEKKTVSGDVFISFERVKANAEKFGTTLKNELHRVMIHGVLHLLGYKDKTKKDRKQMKEMEDLWLGKRKF
jgi:probable rRNA maturation factor